MSKLSRIKDSFLFGAHLVSLSALCIVLSCSLILGIDISIQLLLIVYLTSNIVYVYNYYAEREIDELNDSSRTGFYNEANHTRLKLSVYFIIVCLVALSINFITLALSLFIILGGVLYTIKLKRLMSNFSVLMKSLYVTFFWTILVLFIPISENFLVGESVIVLLVFLFLKIFVNTNFSDIKDIAGDKQEGLKTIPVVLGMQRTLNLLAFVTIASFFLVSYAIYSGYLGALAAVLVFFTIYDLLIIIHLKMNSKVNLKAVAYYLIDGQYILWPFVIMILKLYYGN